MTNKKSVQSLMAACEKIKKSLSNCSEDYIEISPLFDGKDFSYKLTRDEFDEIIGDMLSKIVENMLQFLKCAQIDKKEIDEVLLIGGSSRIPKLHYVLSEYFKLNMTMNANESVAYGASIQAAFLNHCEMNNIFGCKYSEVTGLAYSLESFMKLNIRESKTTLKIDRWSKIPIEKSVTIKTPNTILDNPLVFKEDGLIITEEKISFMEHPVELTLRIDENGLVRVYLKSNYEEKRFNRPRINCLNKNDFISIDEFNKNFERRFANIKQTLEKKNNIEKQYYVLFNRLRKVKSESYPEFNDKINEIDEKINHFDNEIKNISNTFDDFLEKGNMLDSYMNLLDEIEEENKKHAQKQLFENHYRQFLLDFQELDKIKENMSIIDLIGFQRALVDIKRKYETEEFEDFADALTRLNRNKKDFFKRVFGRDYNQFISDDSASIYKNLDRVNFLGICTDIIQRVEYLTQSSKIFLESLNNQKLNMIRTDLNKFLEEYSFNQEKSKEALENQLKESLKAHREYISNINLLAEINNQNSFNLRQIYHLLRDHTMNDDQYPNYEISVLLSNQFNFNRFIKKDELLEKLKLVTNDFRLAHLDSESKEKVNKLLENLSF